MKTDDELANDAELEEEEFHKEIEEEMDDEFEWNIKGGKNGKNQESNVSKL